MMAEDKLILATENLAIGFQSRVIADNINIALQRQQISCLLGRNGCGKSTLFKTLLGILPSLDGQVVVLDKQLNHCKRKEIATVLGFVPQSQREIPNFTVNDIVMMGRATSIKLFAQPSKKDQQKVDESLELIGIADLKNSYFGQLSGGEQQLVVIARSLTQEPQLLIMDEPTSNLDFGNQIHIMDTILALKNQGISILFSTHRPEQALQIADKVFLMQDKRITAQGVAAKVITRESMQRLYQLSEAQVSNYFQNYDK